jgi:hypothetical protein
MKIILVYILLTLTACSHEQQKEEYKTNYPDAPTMQSAEDAMTGKLFNE